MIFKRSLVAVASLATVIGSTPLASAYFIEDVTSGYRVPQKVMPMLLEKEEWPAWIGRLDGKRSVIPKRAMYVPTLANHEWPSWIGRIE
ncbi:hypothetical protein KKC44_02525 [Patescibacteria group bacterium]|nr:hypothetical protein [Patescibacteria group bacterium]MBU2259460.1 hypothetical protein [Patescibacteria group bacterium]